MYDHSSVLLTESILALNIKDDGCYLDGTFGRGGHAAAILKQLSSAGNLFACDRDSEAAVSAAVLGQDTRLKFFKKSFVNMVKHLVESSIKIDGALLDLGVSSPQFDEPGRGFSFRFDAPVDMRMDQDSGQPAHEWLNDASESDIADVIYYYGEERLARRIARIIVERRSEGMGTAALADCVLRAYPKGRFQKHPATKTFQAIRMHVNQELQQLDEFLTIVPKILSDKGRLSIITFHGLERKMLKKHYQSANDQPFPRLRSVGRVIKPSPLEIKHNPRAGSALLTTLEKVA